jgi:hypothetical protein
VLRPWRGDGATAHEWNIGSRVRRRLFLVPRPALIAVATVRARSRASEFGMTAFAIGARAGLCVAATTSIANAAHEESAGRQAR